MITDGQLLESITEAIRNRRRHGPYPNPFELSYINFNVDERRIEMALYVDGKTVKYDLLLDKVKEHGETSIPINVEEEFNGRVNTV